MFLNMDKKVQENVFFMGVATMSNRTAALIASYNSCADVNLDVMKEILEAITPSMTYNKLSVFALKNLTWHFIKSEIHNTSKSAHSDQTVSLLDSDKDLILILITKVHYPLSYAREVLDDFQKQFLNEFGSRITLAVNDRELDDPSRKLFQQIFRQQQENTNETSDNSPTTYQLEHIKLNLDERTRLAAEGCVISDSMRKREASQDSFSKIRVNSEDRDNKVWNERMKMNAAMVLLLTLCLIAIIVALTSKRNE